ncbi:MAG: hypothetical protein U0175_20895 [Caldilineaceae bacterium]
MVADGAFNSPTETISERSFCQCDPGNHTVYVRRSRCCQWSICDSYLSSTTLGPTTPNLAAASNPTNGSSNVDVKATADDSATGNSNIVAAEYFIDTPVSKWYGQYDECRRCRTHGHAH